jgi:hypothetical protein
MKGRRGRAGLKGQLIEKSIDAFVLALETINRLSIKYRVETFAYLICNAWELLLKARLLDALKKKNAIYYKKTHNETRRSLSLRDCLQRIFDNDKDAIRRNVEKVAELRDDAVHLVIGQVPRDVLCLFQACVINYHKKLIEWFDVSLSERVSVGMMTIVYDVSPEQFDLSSAALKKKLGKEAAEYLARYQASIAKEYHELGRPSEYSISVEYKLVLTKKPGEADIVLSHGPDGATATIIEVPKDPGVSHPYRQKELIADVNTTLSGKVVINQYDIQSVNKVYKVKKRTDWFYQGTVKGSPSQYSVAFKDWLIGRFQQDNFFFKQARDKARKM